MQHAVKSTPVNIIASLLNTFSGCKRSIRRPQKNRPEAAIPDIILIITSGVLYNCLSKLTTVSLMIRNANEAPPHTNAIQKEYLANRIQSNPFTSYELRRFSA